MSCALGRTDFPFRLEILGSGIEAEKLRRRVTCALGGLGYRAAIPIARDLPRALDLGATRNPALLLDGALLAEGLPPVEQMEALLRQRLGASSATK